MKKKGNRYARNRKEKIVERKTWLRTFGPSPRMYSNRC